ncbi:MAG: hypothetical protein VW333_12665 [Pseudomonadales bacterium]
MNIEILFLIFLIISTIMLFYINFLLNRVIKKLKEEYYLKGYERGLDDMLEKYNSLLLADRENKNE